MRNHPSLDSRETVRNHAHRYRESSKNVTLHGHVTCESCYAETCARIAGSIFDYFTFSRSLAFPGAFQIKKSPHPMVRRKLQHLHHFFIIFGAENGENMTCWHKLQSMFIQVYPCPGPGSVPLSQPGGPFECCSLPNWPAVFVASPLGTTKSYSCWALG